RWKLLEDGSLLSRQPNLVVLRDTCQGVRRCRAAGRAEHEIEVLLPIVHEVPHFVINAEANCACFHMAPQKRSGRHQIEKNGPASNLRMMVTARMILPRVLISVVNVCRR